MQDTRPDTLEPARPTVFSHERWRENFLRLVLLGAVALGFPAALLSGIDVVRGGTPQLAVVYGAAWVVLLAITLRRWPYLVRAGIVLALMYSLAVSGLLENGMRGDARLFFLGLTIMSAMLLDMRAALVVSAGCLATIGVVGALVLGGTVRLMSKTTVAGSVDLWLVSTLDLALLQTAVLTGLFLFLREFDAAQRDVRSSMEELARGNTLLRTVIDNLPDAVYAKDAGGRRTLANRADRELLGVSRAEDALGRTGAETLPEAAGAALMAEDQNVLRTGRPLLNQEFSIPGPDGRPRWLLVSKLPLLSSSGETVGMVGIDRDITERKHAEEERGRLEERLRVVQRLESMGRLAGGLAHDINNLLLPILGYAELLLTDLPAGDPLAEGLRQIKGAALRTRDLTRKLLAFGRGQALRMQCVDLRDVVRSFGKLLERTLRDDITLRLELPAELGLVNADVGAFEQILLNLVMNAQEAMPGGGSLGIELRDEPTGDPERAAGPGLGATGYISLRVTDSGSGMDAATVSRIFEPFFTTKPRGTGLGLASAYGLVKEHGGTIEVSSAPGRGSEFTVFLPRCSGDVEPTAALPGASPGASPEASHEAADIDGTLGGTESILVVEDEGPVRDLVARGLTRLGYQVRTARGAKDALEMFSAAPSDLLITDIAMAEIDGVELARRIRGQQPGLKVLFISGHEREAIARGGIVEDGMSLLPKPFLLEDLARSVRRMFAPPTGNGEVLGPAKPRD